MGLSENWNVTGMYDKLRVEGMLLPVMSVKCGVCIQEMKGCTENQPEAGFGFMYGYMFSQALQMFYTLGQILPWWRKLLSVSQARLKNSLTVWLLGHSLAFSPGFSQADLC